MSRLLVAVAVGRAQRDEMLCLNQVRSITHLAAEPHDHIGRHVGMMGKAREHTFEDLMIEPFKWQPTSSLVGDREYAVDIGKIASPCSVAEFVRDIPGSAGRAIHRADHGDIIPCADPPIGAQIALKSPCPVGPRWLGRSDANAWSRSNRSALRLWTWTRDPAGIAWEAKPMICPYFRTGSPGWMS